MALKDWKNNSDKYYTKRDESGSWKNVDGVRRVTVSVLMDDGYYYAQKRISEDGLWHNLGRSKSKAKVFEIAKKYMGSH
jgi:hypothetical protein